MKADGKFTINHYTIPFKNYGETIKIVPFGDVHRYAPLHAEKIWHKFIERYCDDKNAYFIGMGDYLDELSSSERKKYINSDYHDSTTHTTSKFYQQRAENLAKEISFMKGRCIGLHEGNHFFRLSDGTTTTNTICRALDTNHLGVKSFIEIILKKDQHHSNRVVICCHHGESGGRTVGTSVNKLEKMAHTHDADIILQGHDHRKNHVEMTEIGITKSLHGKPNIVERVKYCARTGGFLKGYIDKQLSYIADANMPPNSLGNIEFHLTPRRKDWNVPRMGKKIARMEKRWVNIEFHSCNYTEH